MRLSIPLLFSLVLTSIGVVGCVKSETDAPQTPTAQQAAIDKQKQQLQEENKALAMQLHAMRPITTAPVTDTRSEQKPPVTLPTVGGGSSYASASPDDPDKFAKDEDIESALSVTYEKSDSGGHYVVSGQVTNTGKNEAPFIHVYVHLKGFAVAQSSTDVSSDAVGKDGKRVAGEYETEAATLKNVLPGQSRAVNAVFDEPTADEIIGLPTGLTIVSGKSAEGTFHTSVSDSE